MTNGDDVGAPFVGIDIGGTKALMLARSNGHSRTERVSTGPECTLEEIEAAIDAFIGRLPTPARAIGIAVPGLVGPAGNVVACDVPPCLVGWRPANRLRRHAPIFVLNDAEAALIQEADGLPTDATAVVVMVGTGVGAAMMAGGRVVRGANGWAGELGSIPMATAEGAVRTLDQRAGGAAVLRQLGMDADTVQRRAGAGDAAVLRVLRDAGTALGFGLASVINLMNPQRVLLAGGTLTLPGYAEAAYKSAEAHTLPDLWRACELRPSEHGALLVALGAARHAGMCGET
jgi:predicted NBD/HSP70 family sugar kinase